MHQKLGQALLVEAGQEVHVKSGARVVFEAGAELTLKVAGSFIKIDPGGVTVVGPAIRMNSGGKAGSGSGWAGQGPELPGNVVVPPAPPPGMPAPAIHKSMESMAPLVRPCPYVAGDDE